MKEFKSRFSQELINEINDLKARALKIGYKNTMPKLPEPKGNFEQSMSGFRYRLDNWKKQLLQLENPGGMLLGKKRSSPKDDFSQIVINFNEKDQFSDNYSEED